MEEVNASEINLSNVRIGAKFFRYEEGQDGPEVVRVRKYDEIKKIIKYFDANWKPSQMPADKFFETYRYLRPDGVMGLSIVDNGQCPDVIVMLAKAGEKLPCVVCRQMIYDFFTNNTNKNPTVQYVGVSVSRKTCPANFDFDLTLSCNGITSGQSIVVYLDDSLDQILKFFNTHKADAVLRNLASSEPYVNGKLAMGYCATVSDLLKSNNFMYDYRQAFDIMEIPFKVDEDSEGLSLENIIALEQELKVNIMETYLIRYTREIDLRTINRDYVLVASAQEDYEKVYIVGYDKADSEYVPRTV